MPTRVGDRFIFIIKKQCFVTPRAEMGCFLTVGRGSNFIELSFKFDSNFELLYFQPDEVFLLFCRVPILNNESYGTRRNHFHIIEFPTLDDIYLPVKFYPIVEYHIIIELPYISTRTRNSTRLSFNFVPVHLPHQRVSHTS